MEKSERGIEVEWVGLLLDVRHFRLGLSERRLAWAKEWCERMAGAPRVSVKEIQEGLGRLVFVADPLTYAKPFLGPLFAWVAACPLGMLAVPPAIVRLVLLWFAVMATDFPWRPCRVGRQSLGEMFRVDAKA